MKNFRLNLNTVFIAAVIIAVGSVSFVWLSEMGNLWLEGISHMADDVDGYYQVAQPIEGEYTTWIDLKDLESNKGKVLFDDGENQIYISKVVRNESVYEVVFRSSGTFDSGGATLVSGNEYVRNKDGFTNKHNAKAQATYRNFPYKIRPSSSSSLNYRNGDEFGFYLFPTAEEISIDLEKESLTEVTITNLYVNIWSKKL